MALNPGWVRTELAPDEVQQHVSDLDINHMIEDLMETDILKAPLSVEESISRCLSFVSRSTVEDSGKFWSLDGLREPVPA